MAKFKVRFNLGAGVRYMKWKITSPDGSVQYLEPSEVVLTMTKAKMVNQPSTANKIFNGANKTVCAWVEAEDVQVSNKNNARKLGKRVSYNPRVAPNWVLDGKNVDGKSFNKLVSADRGIFLQVA
jgi:hypothetical protein